MHLLHSAGFHFYYPYEVYKAKRQPSLGRLIYFIIGKFSPLRLLVIKPLLSLLVELHIKTKLREIEYVYIQFPATFPLYFDNKEKYLVWVKSAREECQNLLSTLNTPRLLSSFMQSIFNILVALGITTAIINAHNKLGLDINKNDNPGCGFALLYQFVTLISL